MFRKLSIRVSKVFKMKNVKLIDLKSFARMGPFFPDLSIKITLALNLWNVF